MGAVTWAGPGPGPGAGAGVLMSMGGFVIGACF
jgi:hypothetical protein